eukprot:TRINITY_DN47266_c0_g1_i1.p1 TRINITY_DN47266_c0_g1~~TRINITY_DN47266_c0_g1_i1.p1  ORF type:complete len:313 (+),score=59.78 TRINITY_DN47266_c0_g1_i1:84-1022(+)
MAVALASPRGARGDFNAYRKALAIAGKDIASVLEPASNSLHESALHRVQGDYKLNSFDAVNKSLEQDLIRHRAKYVATPNASALPSGASGRFNVELPTSPQHRKYCWAPKKARAAGFSGRMSAVSGRMSTVSQDALNVLDEDSPSYQGGASRLSSKEASSYAGIRASLIAGSATEGMVEEKENEISEQDQAIAAILNANRMNQESLEKTFDEMDQDKSGIVSRRAMAIRLTQKLLLGANGSFELQTPIFNFLKHSCIEFDKSSQRLTKERFIDFCRHAGLMIEYKLGSPRAESKRTPRAQGGMPTAACLLAT